MRRSLVLLLLVSACAWAGTAELAAQPFDFSLVTGFTRPIGVAAVGNKIFITNYCTQDDVDGDGLADGWALWQLDCDGTNLTRVGTFTLDVPGCGSGCQEIYLAVSLGLGGWKKNFIYAIHGDQIFEISPDGTQFSLFVDLLPGQTRCTHSGITFDDVGTWGFDMIVNLQSGEIFRVKPDGTTSFVTDVLAGGGTCEGPDVAPLGFGSEGGNVCITCESENTVKMVRPDGSFTTISSFSGFAPESCHFIPDEPCDCQGQFGFYTANFPDRINGGVATDLAAGAGNLLVTRETSTGGAKLLTPSGGGFVLSDFYNPPGRQHEGSALVECALACTDPDPHTQGYWHRQCLGAGSITPGRNGRGPQEPTEPDFLKTLVPAVDDRLQTTIFMPSTFLTCEDGIDAVPPSDPCERALKQYTALLLNIASNRLNNACSVDPGVVGCDATDVGDLIDELADLINSGDADACKAAADCAAAVNENQGVNLPAPLGPAPSSVGSTLAFGTFDAATGATSTLGIPTNGQNGSPEEPTPAAPTVVVDAQTGEGHSLNSTSAPVEAVDAQPQQQLLLLAVPDTTRTGSLGISTAKTNENRPRPAEELADAVAEIERHLAVLVDGASNEEKKIQAQDALLTALGGGYEPEVRMQIVRGLLGKIDVAYNSLLAKHLEDIRDEARDFDDERLAKEATRLLASLTRSDEPAE